MTKKLMLAAFASLETKLQAPLHLIMGGGGAMLLAHQFPLSTSDVDAVPTLGLSLVELAPLIQAVAKELSLAGDWLNPHYASFTHVLPSDYGHRLIEVVNLPKLKVSALSKEDLLIMKCFAGREKDVIHARALLKKGADRNFVSAHIKALGQKRIPGCEKAEKFLDEMVRFFEEQE